MILDESATGASRAPSGRVCIFGSPHHHNTTSKVERVNGVIADVLRSFAGDLCDDWPDLVPLVEFAINDSASSLGSGYTPFYADRGSTPATPHPAGPAVPAGSGEAAATLMSRVTAEVRALLQERQDRRKEELDAHRRDVEAVSVRRGACEYLEGAHPARGQQRP